MMSQGLYQGYFRDSPVLSLVSAATITHLTLSSLNQNSSTRCLLDIYQSVGVVLLKQWRFACFQQQHASQKSSAVLFLSRIIPTS